MVDNPVKRMLDFVARCDDPEQLRTVIRNAKTQNQLELADAAFRRLVSILPAEQPGTVEHDFWQTIHAFEHILTEERGKTTRLSRTRQKVARAGVVQTLTDWANDKKETDGFRMLIDRAMPELTGEAIVLRHPDQFDEDTVASARARLEHASVDPSSVI